MDMYVVGIGMTAFGRLPAESVKSMTREPVTAALASYAAFARPHMKTFGTTREQIAAAAAKNHVPVTFAQEVSS